MTAPTPEEMEAVLCLARSGQPPSCEMAERLVARVRELERAAQAVFTDMAEIRECSWMEMARGDPGFVVAYKIEASVVDRLRALLSPVEAQT